MIYIDSQCGQESGHKVGKMALSNEGKWIGMFKPNVFSERHFGLLGF
jgi:hypothetical protein